MATDFSQKQKAAMDQRLRDIEEKRAESMRASSQLMGPVMHPAGTLGAPRAQAATSTAGPSSTGYESGQALGPTAADRTQMQAAQAQHARGLVSDGLGQSLAGRLSDYAPEYEESKAADVAGDAETRRNVGLGLAIGGQYVNDQQQDADARRDARVNIAASRANQVGYPGYRTQAAATRAQNRNSAGMNYLEPILQYYQGQGR
jgi:hypothetical protein